MTCVLGSWSSSITHLFPHLLTRSRLPAHLAVTPGHTCRVVPLCQSWLDSFSGSNGRPQWIKQRLFQPHVRHPAGGQCPRHSGPLHQRLPRYAPAHHPQGAQPGHNWHRQRHAASCGRRQWVLVTSSGEYDANLSLMLLLFPAFFFLLPSFQLLNIKIIQNPWWTLMKKKNRMTSHCWGFFVSAWAYFFSFWPCKSDTQTWYKASNARTLFLARARAPNLIQQICQKKTS